MNRVLRSQSRGAGLHRLGAADLSAVDGDRRVVGHVCALNGATLMPLRANSRHKPATTMDFPASEVVPATSSAPAEVTNYSREDVKTPHFEGK